MKHPSCTIKIRHFLQHRFDILKMVEVNSVILIRKLHLSLMEKFVPPFEVAYEYLLNPSFAGVSQYDVHHEEAWEPIQTIHG